MTNQDLENIKRLIGYGLGPEYEEFDSLLQQAFIRKSYSREKGGQNNEVLEFIGDKALDIAVVKKLSDYYGYYDSEGEFCTRKGITEGKLTDIKKKLVNSSMLAHRIEKMGLHEYLIMGKGDINKNVQNEESVKEDLFEAIIGAVAIDSNWDNKKIDDAVDSLLQPFNYINNIDEDDNYIDLIQWWTQKEYGELPHYEFKEKNGGFECILDLKSLKYNIVGSGKSKQSARMKAAQYAYECLNEEGLWWTMQDEIGEYSLETSINKLQELYQKKYINNPQYDFYETGYDYNGNIIWRCECKVDGYDGYAFYEANSKKEAKKNAALIMLKHILDEG